MQANTRCILAFLHAGWIERQYVAATWRFAWRSLPVFSIAFVISLSLTSLIVAADEIAARSTENVDARWLAWIGSWRLTSDKVNENAGSVKDSYLLDIRPGDDGKSIIMKSSQAGEALLEERIVVDGSRQPLKDNKCSGWYKYSWSDTGKRLLFESESGCPGEVPRFISGISIITENRDWLDIQLLRSGEERAISARKYERVTGDLSTGEKTSPRAFGTPAYLAATSLSIDEIIELSHKIAPEVLEAALFELNQPFKINSKTLARLADAKVPSQIVDLMVALSFPDKFTVERHRIAPVQQSDFERSGTMVAPPYVWLPFGYWSIYGPYSNWYWSSSLYPFYGYWGIGWNIWPGGYSPGHHGGGSKSGGGRLINGRGYSKVPPGHPDSRPRYAKPRGDSGNSGGGSSSTISSSSPSASTSRGSGSSSTSGNSGGGSSSPSPSSSSSASPSGYHSDGGGSRGAKPRE